MENLSKKALKAATIEFNEVVPLADDDGNPTPVDVKSKSLERDLYEAMQFIEEGDEFSPETDAVLNELKMKFEPKPMPKKKAKVKSKSVEVGTTVELDVDTNKIKKGKEMKKENEVEIGDESAMRNAAKLVLDRGTKKEQLMELLESGIFDKKQKKALNKVSNFLSLKKQMKEALNQEIVAEVEAEMKAAPKPKSESKPKKEKVVEDIVVNQIKSSIKVKQLKKIAKENEEFDWKQLKKLDFDEMQTEMLKARKAATKSKVKMVPNPLIPMIEKFTKAKKLAKFAKDIEALPWRKSMKKMSLSDLQDELIAAIPAEIPEEDSVSPNKRNVVNHIDQEARRNRICALVDEGTHTRKEIHEILKKEFPEEGKAHTNSNILSECKSLVPYKDGFRWERFGIGRLVAEDKNGCYVWADEQEKPKSKVKKEKKNKKDKKSKKSKK